MVELFTGVDFSNSAAIGQNCGSARRRVGSSPRKPRLDEHSATRLSSNPLDGICCLLSEQNHAPALIQNGLDESNMITVRIIQGLSTSPMFVSRLPRGRRTGYRIEH